MTRRHVLLAAGGLVGLWAFAAVATYVIVRAVDP